MDSQSKIQSPPDTFLTPLLSLRDYYAPLVEEYELLYTQALNNLNHVEALLSNWSSSSNTYDKLPIDDAGASVVTAPVGENLLLENSDSITEAEVNLLKPINSFAQTNDLETNESSQEFQNIEIPSVVDEIITAAEEENRLLSNSDNITTEEVDLVEPIDSEIKQTNDLEIEDSKRVSQSIKQPPELASTDTEIPLSTQQKPLKFSDIPMLLEYQSISRTEAVQKLLQKHAGTVCHIDFIVRSLYGELEPDVFKVVKGRVQSTLTNGRESGKWFLIPSKPGCFTLDLKLLNSKRSSDDSKQGKNKKPLPQAKTNLIPMLGDFEGQFLIDALTSLLQQNPGKVFNVAEVIEELYGELDDQELTQVKPKVLNELSRGHRTGRFSRVPNEIGLYTWDSKLLQQTSAG